MGLSLIFGALITFAFKQIPGNTYEACYQKAGAASATCAVMAASPFLVTVDDDAQYSFWIKENGISSPSVEYKTPKKKIAAPTIVVEN